MFKDNFLAEDLVYPARVIEKRPIKQVALHNLCIEVIKIKKAVSWSILTAKVPFALRSITITI